MSSTGDSTKRPTINRDLNYNYHFKMTNRQAARLRQRARKIDRPISWLLRQAIDEHLDRLDTEERMRSKEVWPEALVEHRDEPE